VWASGDFEFAARLRRRGNNPFWFARMPGDFALSRNLKKT
jgi:hypothetical protein